MLYNFYSLLLVTLSCVRMGISSPILEIVHVGIQGLAQESMQEKNAMCL